jgi:hypothetical protein
MRIESGTTTEHRVRLGIFLAMCIVFAGYFGYDGLWGYPNHNLKKTWENIDLPADQKADLRTNPKVLVAAIEEVEAGMTEEQVHALLGEPAIVVEGEGLFPVNRHWYIGPAAYAQIEFSGGKVRGPVQPFRNEKSESDIRLQKILGVILGAVALVVGIHYLRINIMKTVLDDTGLTAKGCQVPWDRMTELDTSDYERKGWLDVVYEADGRTETVRLDSYHIDRFDEIVTAICERKGFTCPVKPKQAEAAEV